MNEDQLEDLKTEAAASLATAEAFLDRCRATSGPDYERNMTACIAAVDRAEAIKNLVEIEDRKGKNEMSNFTWPDSNNSISPPAKANITGGHDRAEEAPGAFGRFLVAVKDAAGGNTRAIEREMNKRAASGANETIGSEGGFAVDKPIVQNILDTALATGLLPPLCQTYPITVGNGAKYPIIDSSSEADASRPLRARWLEEAGTITASTPKWKLASTELKTLAILAPASMQFLEDAPFAEAWYTNAAGREFGFALDEAIYRGSGAGAPLGVMNAPCTITVDAEPAQLMDTVLAENLIDMRKRCIPGFKYVCLYSVDMLDQLVFLTHPMANVPLWLPAGNSLAGATNDTILGMPAFPFTHCSATGDKGDIMFGAFDNYMLAKKGDVRADTSIHVLFTTAESMFRFIMRIDGQPMLPKEITPKYATANTLSTFVTLAARA